MWTKAAVNRFSLSPTHLFVRGVQFYGDGRRISSSGLRPISSHQILYGNFFKVAMHDRKNRKNRNLTCFGVGGLRRRLYYLHGNAHVNELAWKGHWVDSDMTLAAGVPAAASGSALTCFGEPTPSLIYSFRQYGGVGLVELVQVVSLPEFCNWHFHIVPELPLIYQAFLSL